MNFLLTIARKESILPSNNKTYITCRFVEIGESYEQTNVLSDENEVNQQTKERVTFYVCRNFGSGCAGAHRSIFALLYYLHKKKHVDFGVRTILAVGLGLIVGLAFKGHHTYVAAVGTIYAHVVSAVVIPLLIFSIISSITNLGNSVRLKQIGLKTVFFLVLNTFIASLITLIAGVATNIGSGVQYELATDYTAKEVPTFVDTVISLFPQNLAAHWSNGEVVPIVVFCILVAVSYNKIAAKKPEEVAPFKKFIDAGTL